MAKDTIELSAELEGASAILYIVSNPLLEGDNRQTEKLIGMALNGVAMFLDRICDDVGDLQTTGEGAQA